MHSFEAWAPNLGPCLFLPCWAVVWYMVYNRQRRVPDQAAGQYQEPVAWIVDRYPTFGAQGTFCLVSKCTSQPDIDFVSKAILAMTGW